MDGRMPLQKQRVQSELKYFPFQRKKKQQDISYKSTSDFPISRLLHKTINSLIFLELPQGASKICSKKLIFGMDKWRTKFE
jgi:hypothetical protein